MRSNDELGGSIQSKPSRSALQERPHHPNRPHQTATAVHAGKHAPGPSTNAFGQDRLPILATGVIITSILVVSLALVSGALQSVSFDGAVLTESGLFSGRHRTPIVRDIETVLSRIHAAAVRVGFLLGIIGAYMVTIGGIRVLGWRCGSSGLYGQNH